MKKYNDVSDMDSVKIHEEWEKSVLGEIETPKLTFWQSFVSYVKFEISSIFNGNVSAKIFEKRKNICLSCDGRIKHAFDPIGFCNNCGCGKNPRSRLSVKLTVAGAECPIGKWKKEKGRIAFKNIPKVAIGICVTVWYNVSRLWKRN
jgi:hypothetical protein